ncbi:MAG: hypothetical protein IPH20_20845 [Bacteroidales bacterium]|nr:hypothetical protein [Bacteroidales bacterium]
MHFDISRSNPDIIYSVIYEIDAEYNNQITRAFKSMDGGITWSQISNGTNLGMYEVTGSTRAGMTSVSRLTLKIRICIDW